MIKNMYPVESARCSLKLNMTIIVAKNLDKYYIA